MGSDRTPSLGYLTGSIVPWPFSATLAADYTAGDYTDDVFILAVGLSDASYQELDDLVPRDPAVGQVTGATGEVQIRHALQEVRQALAALVQ